MSIPGQYLSESQIFVIAKNICQALHNLHRLHYVHNDIKPANIFVKGGKKVISVIGDLGFFIVELRLGTFLFDLQEKGGNLLILLLYVLFEE